MHRDIPFWRFFYTLCLYSDEDIEANNKRIVSVFFLLYLSHMYWIPIHSLEYRNSKPAHAPVRQKIFSLNECKKNQNIAFSTTWCENNNDHKIILSIEFHHPYNKPSKKLYYHTLNVIYHCTIFIWKIFTKNPANWVYHIHITYLKIYICIDPTFRMHKVRHIKNEQIPVFIFIFAPKLTSHDSFNFNPEWQTKNTKYCH